ncbi:MAG TPA: MBL fold metallo-hydrolase [Solirubrobacteraceae bacterium]|nr:MBL fold metallo-hydrolase [Solirubrobacteraceae bacterium]
MRAPLDVQVITASAPGLIANSVLVTGEREAVLIDTPFLPPDTEAVIEAIRASGRELTAVLISHAHPDHYFGIDLVRDAFPDAPVYARRPVLEEMAGYKGKVLHWQEMYGGLMPATLRRPEVLEGNAVMLEGRWIDFIDLFMVESLYATAFYLPDSRTLVACDLVYAESHHYMSDIADPDTWIAELERVRDVYEIERVIPGHGPAGGPELIDASIRWLSDWREVAKPGVRITEIAEAMMERYPDHGLALLLWVTRGPGFGLSGAAELGVPPEVLGGG